MANSGKRDPAHVTELFAAICGERGGIDKLSVVEAAVARALAQALSAEPLDPGLIASLSTQLPPARRKDRVERLLIEFVDNGPDQITSLAAELDKAERECRELRSENEQLKRGWQPSPDVVTLQPGEYTPHVVPTAAPRRAPRPEFSDAYELLASTNASLGLPPCPAAPRSGVYLEPDAVDGFGRRIKQT
jgi:hypothetical protein